MCTYAFHSTESYDPDIHVLDRRPPATKAHPACTMHEDWKVTTSMVGLKKKKKKKKVTFAKSHPKW